jgi:hypothetical protein
MPTSFVRSAEAWQIIQERSHGMDDTVRFLSALGQRMEPLDCVFIQNFDLSEVPSPIESETAFLAGLTRVETLGLGRFCASLESWTRIWRSPAFQQNDTLTALDFWNGFHIPDIGVGAAAVAADICHLEVIHECLQQNLFLNEIKLPSDFLMGGALEYWEANIEPLLESNRSHLPRLEPGEDRLSVLHDAFLRVRKHPEKVFNLLVKYPLTVSHSQVVLSEAP